MLGTKFIKGQFTDEEYAQCAEWCNKSQQGHLEDKGEYIEVVENPPIELPIDDTPTIEDLVEAISILTDYVFGESEVADNG